MNVENTRGKPLGLAAAATLALGLATAATGFVALATPAGAATGPTATLRHGTVTITGSAARDVIDVEVSRDQLTVDFGFDGTIDAQFPKFRVQRLSVQLGDGDDGLAVIGTGGIDVPITISGGGGNDGIGVLSLQDFLLTGVAPVTISGDDGNDDLSAFVSGPVSVDAGAGDDQVEGGGRAIGQETISLGDGNDKFISSLDSFVTHVSEIVDGGTGRDILETRGTSASEGLNLSADAGHLIVTHELQDRIDSDNIEDVTWFGFGGNVEGGANGDSVTVNDLSGTDVVNFTPNFSSPTDSTAPNNSPDQITIRGTAGVDHITVSGSGASITVAGLTPTVTPVLLDAQDTIQIETLDGRDTVDSSHLQHGLVQLQVL
jgi:hypothetical protein